MIEEDWDIMSNVSLNYGFLIIVYLSIFYDISFRDTSAEVTTYSQKGSDAAQDLLNSNQAESLDQMD